jgi:hypothetical protein
VKIALIIRCVAAVLALLLTAELSPAAALKKDSLEFPTESINANFAWCKAGKTEKERLARLEAFWERYWPKDGEYEDSPHITYVRLCAYELAKLYAKGGQAAKCIKLLDWLEKSDESIPR